MIIRTPYTCPVCNGAGTVSRPPYIAGDIPSWADSGINVYECKACKGTCIVWDEQIIDEEIKVTV
jgi:hypothetical protein